MTYYNSDGNISTMCGNGGRCVVHHCYSQKIVGENSDFIACDGVHSSVVNDNFVKISMNNVSEYAIFLPLDGAQVNFIRTTPS